MNQALVSSKVHTRATPVETYDWLDSLFRFTIDLAALSDNTKHERFYSPVDNSLAQSWAGETGFLNPPYGKAVGQFLLKARDSAVHDNAVVVALIAARLTAGWYLDAVMQRDAKVGRLVGSRYLPLTRTWWYRWQQLTIAVHHVEERIPFDGLAGAPFISTVVVFASPKRQAPTPSLKYSTQHARRPMLTLGWPR